MTLLSPCMVFDLVKRSNAMSHDVYILSTLCAISMYISFCEFVQTAHSTREKKFLLFSSLKMMTFFHELVRLITVIGIPFKAPFSTLYFVFAVEEFFCRFFQQCQMISGVIWSGFSRLFLQPFATLYFTVHSLKPNYSSIIE